MPYFGNKVCAFLFFISIFHFQISFAQNQENVLALSLDLPKLNLLFSEKPDESKPKVYIQIGLQNENNEKIPVSIWMAEVISLAFI